MQLRSTRSPVASPSPELRFGVVCEILEQLQGVGLQQCLWTWSQLDHQTLASANIPVWGQAGVPRMALTLPSACVPALAVSNSVSSCFGAGAVPQQSDGAGMNPLAAGSASGWCHWAQRWFVTPG